MQLCTYQCALQVAIGNCQYSRHCLLRQRLRLGFKWQAQHWPQLQTCTPARGRMVCGANGMLAHKEQGRMQITSQTDKLL